MIPLSRYAIARALSPVDTRGVDGPDIQAIFTDTRRPIDKGLFVALVGDNFDAHDHLEGALATGACGLVVSSGAHLPPHLPSDCFVLVVEDTRRALTQLADLVRERHSGKFAAVTGSVGKTTVKDMLAAGLQGSGKVARSPGNWNNEIGLPLSLFGTSGDEDFVVLELGMSAAGEIEALTQVARPMVGIVTAAAAAHLEFFESVDAIADAKAELYEALPEGARAVACADDPRILARAKAIRPEGLVTYGLNPEADFQVREISQGSEGLHASIVFEGGQVELTLAALGSHNAVNAAGALAAASLLGVSPHDAVASLNAHFRPAKHRLVMHKTATDAFVLDDSYNANPMSTKAALDTLAGVGNGACGLGAVLGSMLELGPEADALHEEVGRHAATLGLSWLAAIGPHAEALARGAQEGGVGTVLKAEDALQIAEEVRAFTTDGRCLLLKGSRGGRLERLLPLLGLGEVS